MSRLLLFAAAVLAVACGNRAETPYAVIHAGGKPCRPGYTLRAHYFSERDGSHEDACVASEGTPNNGMLDVLKAGEGFGVSIQIQLGSGGSQ